MSGMEAPNQIMVSWTGKGRAVATAPLSVGAVKAVPATEYIRADLHQSALRAAREDALREAADRIRKIAADNPAIALGAATAAAICEAMIEGGE